MSVLWRKKAPTSGKVLEDINDRTDQLGLCMQKLVVEFQIPLAFLLMTMSMQTEINYYSTQMPCVFVVSISASDA